MSYLTLLQDLHRESGIAGAAPTSVTGLSGMPAKLAAWIASAWQEIQSARKWAFLRKEADVPLTAGKRDYMLLADFGLSDVREIDQTFAAVMLPDGSDMGRLSWLPYTDFRDRYGLSTPDTARPSVATLILPTQLRLNTLPDQVYKLRISYWRTATVLAAASDEPTITTEEQAVILWRALMFYAAHEGAADVFADAQAKYKSAFALLAQRYLPQIGFGAPLA